MILNASLGDNEILPFFHRSSVKNETEMINSVGMLLKLLWKKGRKKEDDSTLIVVAAPYSQKGWCHAYV